MSTRHLNNRGDTIVEVMLAFAILALAIAVSYSTANKSILSIRQASESQRGTELAQEQVEYIRFLKDQDSASPANVYQTGNKCIYKLGNPPSGDPTNGLRVADASAGACKNIENNYDVSYTYCQSGCSGASSDSFIVRVTWDDYEGAGKASTQLTYRMVKPE